MGALTSRQNAGVEEADVVSNHAYKYPPRSGKWNFTNLITFIYCRIVFCKPDAFSLFFYYIYNLFSKFGLV